jgi:hypothetical protein
MAFSGDNAQGAAHATPRRSLAEPKISASKNDQWRYLLN